VLAVALGVEAGVAAGEIASGFAEGEFHNRCAEFDMGLAFAAVQVALSDIAKVVQEGGDPEARIERKAVGASRPRQ